MSVSRSDIRCKSQIALLGIVTHNLRALTITILPNELLINLYYAQKTTENEVTLSKRFLKRLSSDFKNVLVKEQQVVLSEPEPIPLKKGDQWIYCRNEELAPLFKIKTFFKDLTISSIRAASQFAMLGKITSNLRALSVAFKGKSFTLNLYFETELIRTEGYVSEYIKNTIEWCFDDASGVVNSFVVPKSKEISFPVESFLVYQRYE